MRDLFVGVLVGLSVYAVFSLVSRFYPLYKRFRDSGPMGKVFLAAVVGVVGLIMSHVLLATGEFVVSVVGKKILAN